MACETNIEGACGHPPAAKMLHRDCFLPVVLGKQDSDLLEFHIEIALAIPDSGYNASAHVSGRQKCVGLLGCCEQHRLLRSEGMANE